MSQSTQSIVTRTPCCLSACLPGESDSSQPHSWSTGFLFRDQGPSPCGTRGAAHLVCFIYGAAPAVHASHPFLYMNIYSSPYYTEDQMVASQGSTPLPEELRLHLLERRFDEAMEVLDKFPESELETKYPDIKAWWDDCRDTHVGKQRMMDMLYEDLIQAPWIHQERYTGGSRTPDVSHHMEGCHHGPPRVEERCWTLFHSQQLEAEYVIQNRVVPLCGLAGVVPWADPDQNPWNGVVEFEETGEARVCAGIEGANTKETLARLHSAMDGCCTAAAFLQDAMGICDSFTILSKLPEKLEVDLRVIKLAHVVRLRDQLRTAIGQPQDFIGECASVAKEILRASPICNGMLDAMDPLHACALAVQLSNLALSSYSNAHGKLWDMRFLVTPPTIIQLLGASDTREGNQSALQWTPKQVAFCDGETRGRVWTLSMCSDAQVGPAKLRGSAQEIMDIWGGSAHFLQDEPDITRCVFLRMKDGVTAVIFSPTTKQYKWTTTVPPPQEMFGYSFREPILIDALPA